MSTTHGGRTILEIGARQVAEQGQSLPADTVLRLLDLLDATRSRMLESDQRYREQLDRALQLSATLAARGFYGSLPEQVDMVLAHAKAPGR